MPGYTVTSPPPSTIGDDDRHSVSSPTPSSTAGQKPTSPQQQPAFPSSTSHQVCVYPFLKKFLDFLPGGGGVILITHLFFTFT